MRKVCRIARLHVSHALAEGVPWRGHEREDFVYAVEHNVEDRASRRILPPAPLQMSDRRWNCKNSRHKFTRRVSPVEAPLVRNASGCVGEALGARLS